MAIETFLIEDAEKMIAEPEHLEEWRQKVEELGLEGQKELMKEEKSPIPFNRLNTEEERVYKELCPTSCKVKDYSESTIPLRVLSLIALAEKEKYFRQIEIWYNPSNPDPIAVGEIQVGSYGHGYFLLARWGDELRAYAELKKMAIKLWKEKAVLRLKDKIKDAQYKLETIEDQAEKHFKGSWIDL